MSSYGVLSFLPHDRPLQAHFMCSSLLNDCPSVSLIPRTGFQQERMFHDENADGASADHFPR